jgi:hypothetical protein
MKTASALIAVAFTLLPLTTTFAQTNTTSTVCSTAVGCRSAPGPILGAGVPAIVIVAGFGIYWLRKRRRKRAEG